MDRRRPISGWRAATFAAALFAITLNFLQPLAHAALMRDGGPMAVSLLTSICTPSTGQDDAQESMPAAGKMHECCLGLAHAPTLAMPSCLVRRSPARRRHRRPPARGGRCPCPRRHPRRAQSTARATLPRLTPESATRLPCVASVCLSWGDFHAIRSRSDACRIRGTCAASGAGQGTRYTAAGDVTDSDAAGDDGNDNAGNGAARQLCRRSRSAPVAGPTSKSSTSAPPC